MNEEKKIKNAVRGHMDELEDILNTELKKILTDNGIRNDSDSLVKAREIFFLG